MPQTSITEMQPEFNVQWDDDDLQVFLNREKEGKAGLFTAYCCSEICYTNIQIYPICLACNKKVTVTPGEILLTCSNCLKTMLTSKCVCGFNCDITIKDHNEKSHDVTVFVEILQKFLEEDVIDKYKDDTKVLMGKILSMKNIDITANTKNVVTEIVQHT